MTVETPVHFGKAMLEGVLWTLVWFGVAALSWRDESYYETGIGGGTLFLLNAIEFLFLVFGVPLLRDARYRGARGLIALALGAALTLAAAVIAFFVAVAASGGFGIPH